MFSLMLQTRLETTPYISSLSDCAGKTLAITDNKNIVVTDLEH